jgi:hypothetical protein
MSDLHHDSDEGISNRWAKLIIIASVAIVWGSIAFALGRSALHAWGVM